MKFLKFLKEMSSGGYRPSANPVWPPPPPKPPSSTIISSIDDKPPTLTEEEKAESGELFIKHNHAVNMEGFSNIETGWCGHTDWFSNLIEYIEDNNPFSEYIYVKSYEEYKNMPRCDRLVWGFWYKDAIINDDHVLLGRKVDRDAIENLNKDNYPIQYFFRKNGFSLKCKLKRFKEWASNTMRPRQRWLTKQIPNEWRDKLTLIPEVNFMFVIHFIEGERALETTDWKNSGATEFETGLKDCYDYIKNRRPKIQIDIENSYPDLEAKTGDYFVDYAELIRLELLLNKEDTKYLIWIINNRDHFWT